MQHKTILAPRIVRVLNSLIASKAQGTAVQSIGESSANMLFCGSQVLQQPKGYGVQPALCLTCQ